MVSASRLFPSHGKAAQWWRPLLALLLLATTVAHAQFVIDEVYSTTHDGSKKLELSNPQIQFTPGDALSSSINSSTAGVPDVIGVRILEHQQHQTVDKVGAGITDSVAILLQSFKEAHSDEYWELLRLLFSSEPEWLARGGVGLTAARAPLGASDFGIAPYTFDDTYDGSTDPELKLFTLERAPKLWATLRDIVSVQPALKLYFAPWSPPGWMKSNAKTDTQPLYGGGLAQGNEELMARYLARAMTAIRDDQKLTPYALSVQNEPNYATSNYPSSRLSPAQAAKVGNALRPLLDSAGLQDLELLAYDHNWDDQQYAIDVLDASRSCTWAGVAWHGYAGAPSAQAPFSRAYPNSQVHFTEDTTVTQFGHEPWQNIKETSSRVIFGSVGYGSQSVVLWNVALQVDEDGFTTPHLPNVCNNCQAPVLFTPGATDNSTMQKMAADPSSARMRTVQMAQEDGASSEASGNKKHKSARLIRVRRSDDATPFAVIRADAAPTSPFYRTTSDWEVLGHMSRATRARRDGGASGVRIGLETTEGGGDANPLAGRVLAQTFRIDGVDASNPETSRWSVVLLNQNDHFETGNFEDAIVSIAFRGSVANFTSSPGLYTVSWLAPRTNDGDRRAKAKGGA